MKKVFSFKNHFFFKPTFNLSWLSFTIILSLFICAINYKLFSYIYANLDGNVSFLGLFVLIYLSLLCLVFSIILLPYLTKFISILLILSAALSSYFMNFYGVIIDYEMLRNVLETDTREAGELLNFSFIFYIFLLGVVPSVFVLKTKITPQKPLKAVLNRLTLATSSLVILAIIYILFSQTLIPFFRNYNLIRVFNTPFYQFYSAVKLAKLEFSTKPEFLILDKNPTLKDTQKRVMVLVVGETERAANYSSGGYRVNDTNFYTKESMLFFNTTACGTSTAISLPCMFSFSNKNDFNTKEYKENVLDILKKAGIKVLWLDNNYGGCKGVCERVENKSFQNEFDGFLINEVKNELANKSDKPLLIVLHLQGSHGPTYYKRYPQAFRKFTPTCDTNAIDKCSKNELINTYDNTLLYTDYILSEIVKVLQGTQNSDIESSLLFISDHGESLGENGNFLHGMPYFIAPKEQIQIPLQFFTTNKTRKDRLQLKQDSTLSHDNLAHSLLGFFEVDTKLYVESLDFLSDKEG